MQIGFNCKYCHASIFLDKEDMNLMYEDVEITYKDGMVIERCKYLPCPLCEVKNFLPLESVIVK